MSLFLVVYIIIYGAMHAYALLRARQAFGFGFAQTAGIGLLMAAMVFGPIAVRLLERAGYKAEPLVLGWVSFVWFGLIFMFVAWSMALDFYRVAVYFLDRLQGVNLLAWKTSPKAAFYIPLVIALVLGFYGYYEAKSIYLERHVIKSKKIPLELGTVRLVQISDVHVGLIVRNDRLKMITRAIKRARPDILVATGDLVDGDLENVEGLDELFMEIKPKYGKFAVTGNHEFYAGLNQSLGFLKRSGFNVLRNETVKITDGIYAAGIDDKESVRFLNKKNLLAETDILSKVPDDNYVVFLKHRPRVEPGSLGYFDLQLSGHTHKGQLFPFNIVTWLVFPVNSGCLRPGTSGCLLHVSRGTGTWGPPIRVFSPPEVTIFELSHPDYEQKRQ